MKASNVILALVVFAFVGSLRSFGLTYEFVDRGNTTSIELGVRFKVYVDGQVQHSELNSLGNNNYKMYWDVDPVQMKTAYTGLKTSQNTTVSGNQTLQLRHYDGGFGGTQQWITDWSFPYTVSLANTVFSDESRVGDYTVSPPLYFNMNVWSGESVNITGKANIKGTYQFNFGSEIHNIDFDTDILCEGIFASGNHSMMTAYFRDDNYPHNLSFQ